MNTKKLKNEVNFLKRELKNILQKITESDIYQSQKELQLKINKNAQQKIGKLVLERLDLPDDRFRMDVSTHPFTTSMGYDDVRITTSYERENGLFSFFSTIHEAGHALYELGLPKNEYKNTVISDSPSLGLHESQSRFWENMIARNKNFWSCFYPEFKKILKNDSLDELYKNVNQVKPSLIRVEADELTYCLHVILRFEIEVGLIEDRIKISELPEIWNEKMKNILGISPNNDKDGVLQDMHWSGGSFGYFPTYAIGSIYASQIFNQMKKENKDLESEIKNGNFENILLWLKKNIHIYGRMINSDEIIKRCCKEGLKSKIFIDYLKKKYFEIYEI
jgi:carboxypeptidase Taq